MFDLTKTFFREQLFKGLRRNILKDNNWGSYNVLPFMGEISPESDRYEIQSSLEKERFVKKKYSKELLLFF